LAEPFRDQITELARDADPGVATELEALLQAM
jgi:hypothetical protein